MARSQVVPKKGRNSSPAKKGRPADRKGRKGRGNGDGRPPMTQGTRPRPAGKAPGGGAAADERRRAGRGDALETGRKGPVEPAREPTRGPEPAHGRRPVSTRAALGFKDDE